MLYVEKMKISKTVYLKNPFPLLIFCNLFLILEFINYRYPHKVSKIGNIFRLLLFDILFVHSTVGILKTINIKIKSIILYELIKGLLLIFFSI